MNCTVKNKPARSSLNDQRAIRMGRIGPRRIVTTPETAKPAWIRALAADLCGKSSRRDATACVELRGSVLVIT